MSFTESIDDLVQQNRTGLLAVHQSWRRVRLGDVATVLNGFPFPSASFSAAAGIPLIRIRDILGSATETFFGGAVDPAYLVDPGDLLVGMDGDFNSAIWHGPRGALNQRVCKITPDENWYSKQFLSYVLPAYLAAVNAATSSVTVKHLSSRTVSDLPLPLPPRREQERIVQELEQHFTRLDSAVAGLKRVQASLKRYRASVLKAACEGRLVPTEAELARREGRSYETGEQLLKRILAERRTRWEADQFGKMKTSGKAPKREGWKDGYLSPDVFDGERPYAIPTGWVWTTVDTVGDVLLGRQRAPQYLTGKWPRPYLRVANVKDDRLDLRDIEEMDFNPTHFEKYRLEPSDILVSEGQSPELVGQSAVYSGEIDGLCFQKTLHRFRATLPGPSVAFVQIVLRSHVKTGLFRKLASITTNIAHLTLEKFKASPFPLPPAAEQARIVAEVDRRLSVVEEVESSIETNLARCARLRQSILKRAFEGKLVAQDPKDEPASVLLNRIREERELPATPRPTAPVLRKATRA